MARLIRTYTDAWLQRHRATHQNHPAFGTHRHPYLHDLLRKIADEVKSETGEAPTLLDYGCGKGAFIAEMSRLGLFRFIRGYDPAIDKFKLRPSQLYDIVVCLDVLDQIEDPFVDPLIEDVAQFTGRLALFNVITVQKPELAHLQPRSAPAWRDAISRAMDVQDLIVRQSLAEEIRTGACPERAIIQARPRSRQSI
jgi:2-polyprenyl-3-methyl-5-hydroxy-6-metoxy-1,4-benzoquinol methylase